MAEPTQSDADAIAELRRELASVSRAATDALDTVPQWACHRGDCVPVDKLQAKIIELEAIGAPWQRLYFWIERKGWLDDKTPVVQTDRRKP
jgi:hypothetical protein